MNERIIQLLREIRRPMAPEEIAEHILPEEPADIAAEVKSLAAEGKIIMTKRGKAALPEQFGLEYGKVQASPKGFGFFVPVNGGPDMFIPAEGMNGALHGDMVWARMTERGGGRFSAGCEVVSVAKRANLRIIGTFELDSEYGGYVIPDDSRISEDVIIPAACTGNAAHGDKVVAQIVQHPGVRRPMMGKITEVLGKNGDKGLDILSIIRRLDLPDEFSEAATKQAEGMVRPVSEEELKDRRDYRQQLTITIDGADARDLDDAVSLEAAPNGNCILGVHIADVSHYVRNNSPIDRDAYKRGTSVYFPDRVLPMLPKELSNGLCSLNPHEDKLTMSCVMEVNGEGRVVSYDISESVICSDYRMTYEDVNAIFGGDEVLRGKYSEILPMLEQMRQLTAVLHRRRDRRGSIDFDIPEADITLDENGHAIDVKVHQRGEAHRMIEEFMLLANETVARHGFERRLPLVYRIHEAPDAERLKELNAFLQTLGYGLKNTDNIRPVDVQRMLYETEDSPEESVVSRVTLRAMTKAKYSPECAGHFGLAMDYYCHFTSPIRRYPDLMVHRALKGGLHGKAEKRDTDLRNAELEAVATHCSDRELAAVEAERAADDIKKCEYIRDHLGEEYEGIISGTVQQGFFVELESTVEGMVRAADIPDDYYIWDDKNYRFVGRASGRQYRLGDRVRVRVTAADMETGKVGFELLQDRIRRSGAKTGVGYRRSTKERKNDKIIIYRKKKGGLRGGHNKGNKKGRGKPKGSS